MSFDLTVFAPEFPEDLANLWPESLLGHGLVVEVYPGFGAQAWRGGFLPFKLTATAGAFSAAARYGREPILAGFEIDFASENPAEIEPLAAEASSEAARLLRNSRRSAYLSTAAGRTVADLRLQCFGAATLAQLSGGVLFDGQQGQSFIGEAAIANAAREAEVFEESPVNPSDWDLNPFPGWKALEPPT